MCQVSEGGCRCQGGCWALHGGLGGPHCSWRPCRHVAAPSSRPGRGSRPPGAHPAGAEASGAGGVWPAATMALGCIVVKAPEVLERGLVTELVLVLREGGGGGSVRASAALWPPGGPHRPQEPARCLVLTGAVPHRLGSGPRTASPLPAWKPPPPAAGPSGLGVRLQLCLPSDGKGQP